MFELLFEHQRPRINYYLQRLRDAFHNQERERLPPDNDSPSGLALSEATVQKLPLVGIRTWVDDRGYTFKIRPSDSDGREIADSEVAVTDDSMRNVVSEVDAVFRTLDTLCGLNIQDPPTPAPELTELQETSLLKDLMSSTWTLWKGARHQSYIRTRLRRRFDGLQD